VCPTAASPRSRSSRARRARRRRRRARLPKRRPSPSNPAGLNRLTRAQLPKGVRDLFGGEALHLRQLESALLAGFRRWGYRDAVPPTFELHENTAVGLGEALD